MSKQKTIKNPVTIQGKGLHTGCEATMTLYPADIHAGITFIRVDLPDNPRIKIDPDNIEVMPKILRCTTIGKNGETVHTVEHFMSALCGLGITNLTIEINGQEVPGLDGSARDFLSKVQEAGIEEQDEDAEAFKIMEPIGVQSKNASIYIVPSDDYRVSYTLNYDHPFLNTQFYETVINQKNFVEQLASCRTFCLEREALELQKSGQGKGANYTNTLVVGEKGVLENEVRFEDEFARHKVLDLIGDLYLLGVPIKGHVFATRSGHELNIMLLKKISEQRKRYLSTVKRTTLDYTDKKVFEIMDIMDILPHRYPFLLVDRVIELEAGKKAVGIKNVTINDYFFQGHFPTRPVMPGVIMVEAMAQTGGVIVLTSPQHKGKLAFFMAVDNVKFRKVVSPGDQLCMEVEVVRDRSRTAQVHGVAKVNDEIVAEADMVFSFTDASYLY